ncbi:MAG TPA: IPTL-CTERM sorting domain-containing protein, partial [Gemmatimonadaceae bacterium]|nr:IPTL-CTERM sorting domain-containing protein [Gemmatimonadaceae bacterium]
TLGLSGSATYAADYTTTPAAPIALVIPSGATEGSLTLTAVDDALDEIDETVVVDITGVTNGTESGTQQVTATITDDDAEPAVSLALAGSPMSEAGGVATVTATLSRPTSRIVTVNLAFAGTATAADYTASATAITIAAGLTSGSITLTAVDDTGAELDETLVVDVAAVTNALEDGTQQVIATITDDDPASLAFATQPSTAVAGEAIAPAVTVQVLDASGRPVPASTASVALAIGSNPAGGTLSGTLTVSAVGGVATFANLVIELSGAGYTLIASSSGLTPATSAPFEITPNAVTTFSGPSTTGTGIVSVSFTGGGAACTFADVSLLNRPPGPDPLPPTSPPGLVFPHGLLRFELGDCERGAAVTFTIVYPEPLPEGTRYWKYGPPASGAAPVWYELPATAISGNRVTFTLTDGGTGDEDGLANGRLRDPGGPAFSSGAIPTLSEWALWLMALMFAGLGLLGIRSSSGS